MKEILSQLNRLRSFFSRKDKIQYLVLLCMMLLGALLDIMGIGAIPAFVAVLAVPEQLEKYPVVMDVLNTLGLAPGKALILWGAGALLGIFIIKNLYLTGMYVYQFRLVEQHRVHLADRLFTAYMQAAYTLHLQRNSAELIRNVQVETAEIIRGIILPALGFIMGALMTVFTGTLLLFATPWVGFVGLLLLGGGSGFFFQAVRRRLKTYGEISKVERKETLQALSQGLGALTDARILGRESYFTQTFRRAQANLAQVERLRQVIERSAPYMLETISVLGMLVIILGLTAAQDNLAILVPTLALFGAATMRLRQSIASMVSGLSQIQYSLPAIRNVLDDIEAIEPMVRAEKESEQNQPSLQFEKQIEVKEVSFAYPNREAYTLHGVRLNIRKGEAVAFVGPTGSGKSTLANLILGLLEPTKGCILSDGQPIRANLSGWRTHIGYVPQFIYLIDGSIRQNIALGILEADVDEAQLWEVIRAAQMEDFIQNLPQKEHTVVGERGVRLSGGQRQRVGLARALYHNPDILVLDEATSSLDNHTESLVMEALEHLKGDRTMIMIAHRLSTVRNCDTLFLLDHGRIAASGSYADLLHHNLVFRQMAASAIV